MRANAERGVLGGLADGVRNQNSFKIGDLFADRDQLGF
jgi:hypothetical protein